MKIIILILFFIYNLLADSNLDKANILFKDKNYIEAIKYYKKTSNSKQKLIECYIILGDNFKKIKNFDRSIYWYKNAIKLKSSYAKEKLSLVYEKKGDEYFRFHDYKNSILFYKKGLKLGNKKLSKKVNNIEKLQKHQKKLTNDKRELVKDDSPLWTKSIGRLIIPTKLTILKNNKYKTKYSKCSASLVNTSLKYDSQVVVTASHCLKKYDKKAGNLRFIIKNSKNEMLERYAVVLKDSKFNIKNIKKVADYAILLLDKKIQNSDVKPIIVDKRNFLKLKNDYKKSYASLGGFSSDIAGYGAKLTYDPKCKLSYYNHYYGLSSCSAYKGASGGPVVLNVSNNGYRYNLYFVGVVSHFKNEKFNKMYFSSHDIFVDELIKIINSSNQ
ncbi:MAG: trypsin-like serine protease [Campylobacterota bacterium]|nr:trypsin-like serine protease [Campylobacterota bacterium]